MANLGSNDTDLEGESLNVDVSNSVRHIKPSASLSEIETALASSGKVVFDAGTHSFTDWPEITADNVTVEISPNATVQFETGQNLSDIGPGPTDVTVAPLFYANGRTNVWIINYGEMNARLGSYPRNDGWAVGGPHLQDCIKGGLVNFGGVVTNCVRGGAVIDCVGTRVYGWEATENAEETILAEGTIGCRFEELYGGRVIGTRSPNEVLNLNRLNSHYVADGIYGSQTVNCLEIEESPYGEVTNVVGFPHEESGDPALTAALVNGEGLNTIFSDRAAFGHCNNVTIDGVYGETSGPTVRTANNAADIKNLHVKNFNAVSQASRVFEGYNRAENQLEGLTIEGHLETEATDRHCIVIENPNGTFFDGANFDVRCLANGDHAVLIRAARDPTGTIRAKAPGARAVLLSADGHAMDDADLKVIARDSDTGLYLNAFNGGSVGGRFTGVAKGNSTQDIFIDGDASTVKLDMAYDTITNNGPDSQTADYSAL